MPDKCTVIAISNQKGGVGKTSSTFCLGAGLANEGKAVLLIDLDPQGDLTKMCGIRDPHSSDKFVTIAAAMNDVLSDASQQNHPEIQHHPEGFDFVGANRLLSTIEVNLINVLSRERVLSQYIDTIKDRYDFILIDCRPALGMLVINAVAAADYVIIPVQPEYFAADALMELVYNVKNVKRAINPKLEIMGAFVTMMDKNTVYRSGVSNYLHEEISKYIPVFKTAIPRTVRMAEISMEDKSIFVHDPKGAAAKAYRDLTKEVLEHAQKG